MILGIGTDITSIERIEDTLARQGKRFIARCFVPQEQKYVEKAANGDPKRRAAGYAKRWAAKEACAKALGTGIRGKVALKDIIVTNDKSAKTAGQPRLTLRGGAKERLTGLTPKGMTAHLHLSLSDDPPMALAFVVISAE